MLPQLLKFERGLREWSINVQKGMATCPNYHAERNRPSLWTYYETLPDWCRNNQLMRQTLFAFEYHKPHLNIRQKEEGLNFVAHVLRPVEGVFRQLLTEAVTANKLRVTCDNGKEMMQELGFYTIDIADLGSDTEGSDGDDETKKENRMIMSSAIDEEEEQENKLADQIMGQLKKGAANEERRQIYDVENSIAKYQLDPVVQQCLTDFPTKDYAGVDEVQNARNKFNEHLVPINYYDNEDGFWDEYIAAKQQRQFDAGFLTNRRFIKH